MLLTELDVPAQVSKTCGKVDLTELKVDGLAKTVEGYEVKIAPRQRLQMTVCISWQNSITCDYVVSRRGRRGPKTRSTKQ